MQAEYLGWLILRQVIYTMLQTPEAIFQFLFLTYVFFLNQALSHIFSSITRDEKLTDFFLVS